MRVETSTPRQPLSPSNSMKEDKEHWARSRGIEVCKAAASNAKEEEEEEEEDALSPSKVIPQQFRFDPNHWCPSRRIRGHNAARGLCHRALAGGPREYGEPLSNTSNSIKRFHTHAVFRIPKGARCNGSERGIDKEGANEVRWEEGGGHDEETDREEEE